MWVLVVARERNPTQKSRLSETEVVITAHNQMIDHSDCQRGCGPDQRLCEVQVWAARVHFARRMIVDHNESCSVCTHRFTENLSGPNGRLVRGTFGSYQDTQQTSDCVKKDEPDGFVFGES